MMTEIELRMAPHLLRVGPFEALEAAMKFKMSAYDARFLRCAIAQGRRVVTEDVKLRHAAPRLTSSLEEALAGKD